MVKSIVHRTPWWTNHIRHETFKYFGYDDDQIRDMFETKQLKKYGAQDIIKIFKKGNEEEKEFFKTSGSRWSGWPAPGQGAGLLAHRSHDKQYTYRTSTEHMPWIEYKQWPEVQNLTTDEIFIKAAESLASHGKTIDFFWSGGIDSTAALCALVEVCPKQLRILIGGGTEYEDYFNKVIKGNIDYEIDNDMSLYSMAKADKHIWSWCGEIDQYTGGALYITDHDKLLDTEWLFERLEIQRESRFALRMFRFISDFPGDKIDMSNCLPFYTDPWIEKWMIREHHKRKDGTLWPFWAWNDLTATAPWENENAHDDEDFYLTCKKDMRNMIYNFTKDAEYAFGHQKYVSLDRAQRLTRTDSSYKPRAIAITSEGDIITEDNKQNYSPKDLLVNWKE